MSILHDFPGFLHGADYNPDQWLGTPEVIDEDFRLMDKAHCNTFSIGIFSWSQYEKEEGNFDFTWLDDIMERCRTHGKKVFLATPSAARPAWLGNRYPETNRVDETGCRLSWGSRANHCWSSPVIREKLALIISKLAERYAKHPSLAGWHISNEYHGACRCPLCKKEFVDFLKKRYGSLDRLNECYWSAFWGHRYSAWEQVDPDDRTIDLAQLDFLRFNTQQVLDFMRFEIEALRDYSDAPVTTNMMGVFEGLDYWRIAEACDFIADDCYPTWYKGETEAMAARYAMYHDMHYSMKNKPFLMMESCPGIPNYKPYCKIRRPGEFEREMLLALGHGADGTMYFQWRKGRGNCEKIHGAVVGHDGTDRTLAFQRVADYGAKLERIREAAGSAIRTETALIYDWESAWALHNTKGFGEYFGDFSRQRLIETVCAHYQAVWTHNVPLSVIESSCDFSSYKILIAPMLFMMKPGVMEHLIRFVEEGGTLVMTYLSACVDEHNLCFASGNPGGKMLRELFGIWSEDIDIFEPETKQTLRLTGEALDGKTQFDVLRRCEYLHAEGARVLGVYGEEFYAGTPALTVNQRGKGRAYYIGADTGLDFLEAFYGNLLKENGMEGVLPELPRHVKATRREKEGKRYYFVQNMSDEPQSVRLPRPMRDIWNGTPSGAELLLPPCGSAVLLDS